MLRYCHRATYLNMLLVIIPPSLGGGAISVEMIPVVQNHRFCTNRGIFIFRRRFGFLKIVIFGKIVFFFLFNPLPEHGLSRFGMRMWYAVSGLWFGRYLTHAQTGLDRPFKFVNQFYGPFEFF